ncbi:MAG: histidine kinase dimerization/phospho-acceptor domain-containing protein [Candidatus Zixiibacteriota bacterium]
MSSEVETILLKEKPAPAAYVLLFGVVKLESHLRVKMETSVEHKKFLLLKNLAGKINSPADMSQILQEALGGVLEILNLQCASVTLWEEKTKKIMNEVASGVIEKHKILRDFDQQVMKAMGERIMVQSIYATIDMEGAHSVFSYPIKREGHIVGAIAGLVEGYRNLSAEEEFLEALSDQLGIAFAKVSLWEGKIGGEISDDLIKSERLKAMIETAVTINHEVNNPLAAVLGYVQLILSRPENLNQETIDRLKKVETGALRIKDVTNRLLKIVEPVIVKYAGEVRMVDLKQSKTKENET